jgi:hypothetical protein
MTPILLILALAATSPTQQDLAGNRLEAFAPRPDLMKDGGPPLLCTADQRWCAEISRDVDLDESTLHVFAGPPNENQPPTSRPLTRTDDEDFALWPSIVRLAGPDGGVFIGVERHVTTSYSGGGGGATQLELIRVPDAGAAPVLTAPIAGSLMIRACFDERDMRARRGACHDEYSFAGDLALDPTTASGPPRFVFETRATTFPAGVSRNTDSLARGRLRRRDLVQAPDPACSYRRIMTFDPATETYAPDTALPDCGDYTVP